MKSRILHSLVGLLSLFGGISSILAQGTAFTYQGRLNDSSGPASGIYDLRSTIYDALAGGSVVGGPLTNAAVGVSNGLFTVTLNFGEGVFTGSARWLELGVRTNGGSAFTTLAPRQAVTPAPYAMYTMNAFAADTASVASFAYGAPASGVTGTLGLNQLPAAVLTNNQSGVTLAGTFSGNGAGLTNLNAARLTGTISSNNIAAGTISGAMLTAGAVGSSQLADGAVTATKVATVTNWLTLTITNPSPADSDLFGYSMAAVGTDRVLVGVAYDDLGATDSGVAYLFRTDGTLLTTFTNPTPAAGDNFGIRVAAVGTDRVLIGAYGDSRGASSAGVAYLFRTDGPLLTTFTNPAPTSSGGFGISVAALGTDRVLIGANGNLAGGVHAGAAYLFSTNGALLTTFTNPTPAVGDDFGWSASAVGSDRVVIGAQGDSTGASGAGAAYLFSTNGALLRTLTNPAPAVYGSFGRSLAAVGADRVLIAAYLNLSGPDQVGAAYLFSTNGALLTTFANPTPAQGDYFGCCVAAVGTDRVVIGAYGDDTAGTDAGAAYLFSTNGALLITFANPAPAKGQYYGMSAAGLGTERVLVGAPHENTGATGAGTVYLFSPDKYAPGLLAEGVHAASISTASLADGAVTAAKIGGVLSASQIPNLSASQITSGTLALAQLPTAVVTNNETGLTLAGAFSGNGGGLTNLSAANLTGTLADAQLSPNAALRNTTNIFTATNWFSKPIGIGMATTNLPGQLLQVGDQNILAGSVGMIRLASRYASNYRIWDIGVAQNIFQPAAYDYSFVIDDTLLGTGPEFMIHWGNGYVGIGKTNPATALDVNGVVTASAFTGSGSNLTSLSAGQLASGTVPDARLSPNVSLLGQTIVSSEIAAGTIEPVNLDVAGFNNTFWRTAGNAGTGASTNFVGTTDNQPLELRVNNLRVLRLEPSANGPNVIGGYSGNFVGASYYGSTIGGGGSSDAGYTQSILAPFSTISGGAGNTIGASANFSSIAGGVQNTIASAALTASIGGGNANSIGTNSNHSAIGGGLGNDILNGNLAATIAGGSYNGIGINADNSAIGGGDVNNIADNSQSATIAGGNGNIIGASSSYSLIGGGSADSIGSNSGYATIAGGSGNSIGANSGYSSIGGGSTNTVAANGMYATIPGGRLNTATNYAFAAGNRARANHLGAFVWGDSTAADIASTNANSVTMRASGGYRLFSNSGSTAGAYLAPGGGSWTSMSDRNTKENFEPVDTRALLEKVVALPLSTWNYKSQDTSLRHIGPMAQDFKAAFGVGETDTGITSIDADGVALAAIQALNQHLETKDAEIQELKARLEKLESLLHEKLNGGGK